MKVKKKAKLKTKIKIGLALGGGSAKGLAHIGVLKVLHKHHIYPSYLAGSSIGAIIAAAYAAGHSPEEMEKIAKSTDWKSLVDFTIPKAGLIKGCLLDEMLNKLVYNKKFRELNIPLKVVAYNLDTKEKVIFSKGNVARALRASVSLPGIFTPVRIGAYNYVDGGLIDPTPFDVVEEMGADFIIAVDLYVKEKTVSGPIVKEKGFLDEIKQKFIAEELLNIKNYLIPTHWPKMVQKFSYWLFDKLLFPARVLKIIAGRDYPPIAKTMYSSMIILLNNLAKERMDHAKIDLKINFPLDGLDWMDFDRAKDFIKAGEKAMNKQIPNLKRLLRRKGVCLPD